MKPNMCLILRGGDNEDRQMVLKHYLYDAMRENDMGVDPTEFGESEIVCYYEDRTMIIENFEVFTERGKTKQSPRSKHFVFSPNEFNAIKHRVIADVAPSNKPHMRYPERYYKRPSVEHKFEKSNCDDFRWYCGIID